MTKKLDPGMKARWVAALRSGKFKQGYGQLCTRAGETLRGEVVTEDHHCCLGVLNEVEQLGCADDEASLWVTDDNGSRRVLDILDEFASSALISRNDKRGQSFAQIADWIEENL